MAVLPQTKAGTGFIIHVLWHSRCESVWPSGKASRGTSVRIRFGSPFYSKIVACGHCLATLSFTINETLKWLSSLPILMHVILVVTV